jgi:circadian clock protein KaiC
VIAPALSALRHATSAGWRTFAGNRDHRVRRFAAERRRRRHSALIARVKRALAKIATGIKGFDGLSLGGLPSQRTTVIKGGPGAGKTVFAVQTLVNAIRERQEAGILVAFEENSQQIRANAATFDWALPVRSRHKLFIMDARLSPEVVHAGSFDLNGMLAMLAAKKKEMGAKWIVFDGIDVLLTLLNDPMAEMREIYRIRDWLTDSGMSAIITLKADNRTRSGEAVNYNFLQFMADCVIHLGRRLEQGVPLHRIEITKYRGSGFIAGEYPVSFGTAGMEVGSPEPTEIRHASSAERVSFGFERLDTMLGGGLFRGSSTLITGPPGTSKTTLAGKFAEAACRRGERTLFVSFDEGAAPIQRNLTSVGIHLKPHVKSGLLRMHSGRTQSVGAEDHLLKFKSLLREHQPRCVVIDPISAMSKSGGIGVAREVASRLIYAVKDEGITVLLTAINRGEEYENDATDLQISTIADTWIQLSYLIRGGERNRALTIVKSRGTRHSNQVRELLLSSSGLELADVYAAGGEVLMGALRWEKENEEQARIVRRHAEFEQKRGELQAAEAETHERIKALQLDLARQRAGLTGYASENHARIRSSKEHKKGMREIRSADSAQGHSRSAGNGTGNGKGGAKAKPGAP